MGGRRWFGVALVFIFFAFFGRARAASADGGAEPGLYLQIEFANNHFDLSKLMEGDRLIDQLGEKQPEYLSLAGWDNAEIRIPLGEKGWGLYAQYLGWYWLPGETALFVYNAKADRLPATGEIYDLEAYSEEFAMIGVYASYALDLGGIGYGLLYVNAFACPIYESFSVAGLGYLYPGTDQQEGELQASGWRYRLQPWMSFGLGASLSWRSHLAWENGMTFEFEAHNLLGLVYFPKIHRLYQWVDYESIAPTPINGHLERGSDWADLPCLLKGVLSYPCLGGEARLTAVRIGKVQDYMVSFAYPWREVELSAGYDPVLDNISLGLSRDSVSFHLYFSEEVMGLRLSLDV